MFDAIVPSAKWYVEGHHSPSYPIGAQVKEDIHDIDWEPKPRPRYWRQFGSEYETVISPELVGSFVRRPKAPLEIVVGIHC